MFLPIFFSVKPFLAILFCTLFASGAFGLFLYQSGSGRLASVLGKPALAEGTKPFDFQKKEISKIEITQNGETNIYTRSLTYWSTQRNDKTVRADYNKLDQLLYLFETARVQQELPDQASETAECAHITLTTDTGTTISATLISQLPRFSGLEEPLAPSFSLRLQNGRYYACTSELTSNYPDFDVNSLTDHRPFFFHPDLLSEFSYQTEAQTVTITRHLPNADWIITSPLKLRTDEEAVNSLVNKLYTLEAKTLNPKETVQANAPSTLTIKSFSSEIPPQQLFLSSDTAGNIDNHPFTYQFPEGHLTTILPSIDALRSKKLADIEVDNINSILLQSKTQSAPVTLAILPTASGAPRWMYQVSTDWIPASETGVASLLTAITKDSVQGFSLETISSSLDADKSVTIQLKDGKNIHFDLLRTKQHTLIQRKGESFAAILSPVHARKFQTEPTVWKDNQLWTFSAINLRGIQRRIQQQPLENYSYNFNLEQWKGQVGNKDVSADLDLVAANAYLNLLESLQAVRWLPASQALRYIGESTPVAEILALSQKFSDMGDSEGLSTNTLKLYTMPGNQKVVLVSLEQEEKRTQYAHIEKKVALRLISSFVLED